MKHEIVRVNKVIPIESKDQEFAYQREDVFLDPETNITIWGHPPPRRGVKPYPNREKDEVEKYELKISKHTSNALLVTVKKHMKDGKPRCYQTTMSFSDLVNQIFKNLEAYQYEDF